MTPFQGETSIFILVSIHTPTQGVTHYTYPYSTSLKFQSTHPRRVWQSRDGYQGDNEGFNPHTHAGCDTNSPDIGTDGLVSIHTPTQGVTSKSGYGVTSHHVSIHTPTQGVTFSIRNKTVLLQFQSTHPRRVWLVSVFCPLLVFLFQSTHPRRVWLLIFVISITTYRFQSTHPRRVWRLKMIHHNRCKRFNPHTHAGCD